jgi:hypothetical protein
MFAQDPAPLTQSTGRATLTEAEKVRQISQRDDFFFYSFVLVGILLACAGVFFFVGRWLRKPDRETDRELSLSLSSFRQMYENGEITEAEYKKLRDKLAPRLKSKDGATPPPAATPPPDPPPPDTPPEPSK